MALVTDLPKAEDGMERIEFSGMPSDSFDNIPATGEEFVMTVRVRVGGRGETEMAREGIRHSAKLKVVDAVIGRGELPDRPEQLTIDNSFDDDAHPEYGDA